MKRKNRSASPERKAEDAPPSKLTGAERVCEFFGCDTPKNLWRSEVGNSGLFNFRGALQLTAMWSNTPTNLENISKKGLELILNHPALKKHKTLVEWEKKSNQ
jgi:hypothetical protein